MTMPQGRLKILLLDNGKEWGGGTNSLLELLKRIDRDRFEITCCFYHNYRRDNEETIGDVLNAMGIPTRFIVQRRQPSWAKLSKEILRGLLLFNADWRKRAVRAIDQRWRVAPNARRIADLLRAGKYQLLYMNNQPSSNVEGYLAAESLPVAVVQHCRIEPLLDPLIVARVNRGARCVIAVSDGVRQTLVQGGVRPALCQTVFNGIDIHQPLPDGARLRESLGADARTFLFGSIGSLIARKAHDHTLRALRAFQQAHPDARWKMVLVGSGSEQANLARQAAQLGLGDRVIFTGFQRNAMEYLAAFDTLILASRSEGLPRVVLEAMLLGTPVIGSAVTGTAELVRHQDTGLLFPYGDVAQLAHHLATLYSDADQRRLLARRANERLRRQFTIENYVAGVEAVLAGGHSS